VPKDTKKFINPLLRSSQESSARVAPAPVPSPVPEPELESQKVPDEETIVAPSTDMPSSSIDTEAIPEIEPASIPGPQNAAEPEAEPESEPIPAPTRKARAVSGTNINREESDEKTVEPPTSTVSRVANSARRNSSVAASNLDTAPRSVAAVSTRQAKAPREVEGSMSSTFTRANAQDDIEEDSTKAGQRRRRSTQPFETTHERITLWIDKQLKQDFEDLAYDRNLSKSALLNEAITELLKKYEPR
jgi:hypothetical protein